MKIFGVSAVVLVAVFLAYYAGTKNVLGGVLPI